MEYWIWKFWNIFLEVIFNFDCNFDFSGFENDFQFWKASKNSEFALWYFFGIFLNFLIFGNHKINIRKMAFVISQIKCENIKLKLISWLNAYIKWQHFIYCQFVTEVTIHFLSINYFLLSLYIISDIPLVISIMTIFFSWG